MKTLIPILIFLLPCVAKSQEQESFEPNRFNIKIAPLALIDIYNGSTYRIGAECKFIGSSALVAEYGGFFKNFNGLSNIKGYMIRTEFRYYVQKSLMNNGIYASAEYQYKNQYFEYGDSIQTTPRYYTDYSIQKFVTCLNLRVGSCARYKRFVFELSGGAGVRIKKVSSSLTDFEKDHRKEYGDSQSLYFTHTPGKFIYPNLDIVFRVGIGIF